MTPTSAMRPLLTEDERIKAEIRVSLAQSASAFKRGDVEAILRAYAPDAVVLDTDDLSVDAVLTRLHPRDLQVPAATGR